MDTMLLLMGLKNPIENEEVIEKIIKGYKDSRCKYSEQLYSKDFYANIVKGDITNKVHNIVDRKTRDEYEVYKFNKWKQSVLSYKKNEVKEEYRSKLQKLRSTLIRFNPTTQKEIREFLENEKFDGDRFVEINTDAEYKEILNLLRYNRIGEDSGWDHVSSKFLDPHKAFGFEVQHRFYINTNSNFTHKFALLFMQKCDKDNVPYYYKLDDFGDREDTIVIYACDELIPKYIKILREIERENKEVKGNVHKPPMLAATIDNWIGFASEPSTEKINGKGYSFNTLRTELFDITITNIIKKWLIKNKDMDVLIGNERKSFKYYIADILSQEKINKMQKNAKNSFSKDEGFLSLYGYTKLDPFNDKFINHIKNYYRKNIDIIFNNIGLEKKDRIELPKIIGRNNKEIGPNAYEVNSDARKLIDTYRIFDKDFKNTFIEEVKCNSRKYHIYTKNVAFDANRVLSLFTKLRDAYEKKKQKINNQEIRNSSYGLRKDQIIQDEPINPQKRKK